MSFGANCGTMSKITGGGYLPEWSGLMKIMAIDLGDARTGVAVSDTLGMLTGQTSVIESWNKEKTAQLVAEAYRKSGAERLVMGFPRNMDGSARICTAHLRQSSRNLSISRSSYGMKGVPRLRRIRFCPTTTTTAKSAKKPSTRSPRL